jgi:hypothetical protein
MNSIYLRSLQIFALLISYLISPSDLCGQTGSLFKYDTLKIMNEHEGVSYSYARFLGESHFNVAVFNSDAYSGPFNPHFSYFVDKDGTWQEYQVSLSSSISLNQLFVVDFDRDGLDDIITCDSYKVALLRNTSKSGLITFADAVTLQELDRYIDTIYLYDINQDGYEDIIADNLQWIGLNNRGKGLLSTKSILPREENSYYKLYLLSDLNQDGHKDIIMQEYGEYIVYPGLGDGAYGNAKAINWGASWADCQFDFDGNGQEELVSLLSREFFYNDNRISAVSFDLTTSYFNDTFLPKIIKSISIDSVEYFVGMRCHIQPVCYNNQAPSSLLLTVVLETKTIYYLFNCDLEAFTYIRTDTSFNEGSMPFTQSYTGHYFRINRPITNWDSPQPFPVMIEKINSDLSLQITGSVQNLAAEVNGNSVVLSWSYTVNGPIYYNLVLRNPEADFYYKTDYLRYFGLRWDDRYNRQTKLSKKFSHMKPGVYTVKIVPINLAQSDGQVTDSIQFTIHEADPPAVPQNVEAAIEAGKAKISFTMTTLFDSIEVYRCEKSDFEFNVIKLGLADPLVLLYFDSTIEPETQYFYHLKAYLNGFSSDFSTIVSVNSPDFFMAQYTLAESGFELREIIPCDLNNDSHKDLLLRAVHEVPLMTKILFLPGSTNGFDVSKLIPVVDDLHISSLYLGDWNGDSYQDLITEVITFLPENSATVETIKIWFLNKLTVMDTISFKVPYNYDGGMPLSLIKCVDIDLDGIDDLLLNGSNGITIGWNDENNIANFIKLNRSLPTQTVVVYDYNQDGYPDLLADNYTFNKSYLYENNRDGSFLIRTTGLPTVKPTATSGHYRDLKSMWLTKDAFPDLLAQRANEGGIDSYYEIYEFQSDTKLYQKSSLQIDDTHILGKITPIHLNNDGYIDFVEVSPGRFKMWLNEENATFRTEEHSNLLESFNLQNIFNLDADNDNDPDAFFSFYNSNILYQIVNTGNIDNQAPTIPGVGSVYANADGVKIEWSKSQDDKALTGHLDYILQLRSEQISLNLATHLNELTIKTIPDGQYMLTLAALDPMGFASGFSDPYTFETPLSDIRQGDLNPLIFQLKQNYPNPFNPSTMIEYQIPKTGEVKLSVYNLLGQKVATLVSEKQQAGIYQVEWNARGCASGIHFYKLTAGKFEQVRKMVLLH